MESTSKHRRKKVAVPARSQDPQNRRIDDLYGLPPAEFTQARNALAKELRAHGDADAAGQAAASRKPTTAAWAVNQLVRREPGSMRELLALGEELREAQRRLVGGGDAAEVLALSDRERGLVQRLVERASEILTGDGARASEATLDEVRETLHAAAVDEEAAEEVAAGRLVKERRAIGFGLGAGPAPSGRTPPKRRPRAGPTRAERRLEQARASARDARRKADEAEDRLAGARREAEVADRAVRRAEGAARQATRAADQAEERERKAAEALDANADD